MRKEGLLGRGKNVLDDSNVRYFLESIWEDMVVNSI